MRSLANPNMNDWFKKKMDEVAVIMKETAQESAATGKRNVREFVQTRGTEKSGKEGRIETGAMLKAVRGKTLTANKTSASSSFGWIEGPPEYTRYQEHGFTHVNGVDVAGMYALADASEIMKREVKDILRSKLRGL